MRYRKKPVIIDALPFVLGEKSKREWLDIIPEANIGTPVTKGDPDGLDSKDLRWFGIPTFERTMQVSDGDWIIRGTEGEFYPCKPAAFAATFEPADA